MNTKKGSSHNTVPRPPSGTARGFTLVELLVVLCLMGIIAVFAIPALSSVVQAYSVDAAGQGVQAQLALARGMATTMGRPVEVRFYQIADYNQSTPVYRGMQLFLVGASSTTPLAKPYLFPAPVRVFQATVGGTNISSLLTPAASGISTSTGPDPANPLPPPIGLSYQYSYFHFRASGQTDLSTSVSANSLLTLASESAKIQSNGLPSNYVTLELNALSGVADVYRP